MEPIDCSELAPWRADKPGKADVFQSDRLLVGLNAFEPGQVQALLALYAVQ